MDIKKTLAASALAGAMAVTAAAVPASASETKPTKFTKISKVKSFQHNAQENTQQNVQVTDIDQNASADGGEALAGNIGNNNTALSLNVLTLDEATATSNAEQNNVAVADASGGQASNDAEVNQVGLNVAEISNTFKSWGW